MSSSEDSSRYSSKANCNTLLDAHALYALPNGALSLCFSPVCSLPSWSTMNGVAPARLRRLMCNELDQQVRQVTKWPAERSVGSLGAGIRCDLGRQARQQ